MRIAYITEVNITYESGITLKTRDQVMEWIRKGHEVIVYSLSGKNYSQTKTVTTEFTVKSYTCNLPWLSTSMRNLLNKVLYGQQLEEDLRHFCPHIVYYRQGMWFPALDNIFQLWPVVMEVNTNDKEEYRMEGYLKRCLYLVGRERILKRISGVVAVTAELARRYLEGYDLYVRTISNGASFHETNNEREVSERPQLIFVGTTGVMPWQGEDKVIIMAEHMPQFDFHIVGGGRQDTILPENVFSHGYLPAGALKEIYRFMDVGIGTLALHRKGMEEASPLKVREYCRYGLPVIAAYHDTDLEGMDCVLRIENMENNILPNLGRIKEFVLKWYGKRVDITTLRGVLDISVKERQRIAFFEEIIAEKCKNNDGRIRIYNRQQQ